MTNLITLLIAVVCLSYSACMMIIFMAVRVV